MLSDFEALEIKKQIRGQEPSHKPTGQIVTFFFAVYKAISRIERMPGREGQGGFKEKHYIEKRLLPYWY